MGFDSMRQTQELENELNGSNLYTSRQYLTPKTAGVDLKFDTSPATKAGGVSAREYGTLGQIGHRNGYDSSRFRSTRPREGQKYQDQSMDRAEKIPYSSSGLVGEANGYRTAELNSRNYFPEDRALNDYFSPDIAQRSDNSTLFIHEGSKIKTKSYKLGNKLYSGEELNSFRQEEDIPISGTNYSQSSDQLTNFQNKIKFVSPINPQFETEYGRLGTEQSIQSYVIPVNKIGSQFQTPKTLEGEKRTQNFASGSKDYSGGKELSLRPPTKYSSRDSSANKLKPMRNKSPKYFIKDRNLNHVQTNHGQKLSTPRSQSRRKFRMLDKGSTEESLRKANRFFKRETPLQASQESFTMIQSPRSVLSKTSKLSKSRNLRDILRTSQNTAKNWMSSQLSNLNKNSRGGRNRSKNSKGSKSNQSRSKSGSRSRSRSGARKGLMIKTDPKMNLFSQIVKESQSKGKILFC